MATLPAIEPLRVPNPLEGYAQVEQILGARQQREANALVMQQRQQALEAEEQIRRYQAGGGDPRGLLRFGAAGVQAFEKLTQAEERYAKNVQERLAIGRELMLRAPDAQSLARAVRSQFDDPVLGPTLAGMRLNADQMVEHVLKNSTTPSGFNEMRLLYGQGAENLAKFIQEKIAEHQVAAALGGGAPGAPAGALAAPAAGAGAGTAVTTPVAGTTAAPEVIDYASRWQQMVNAGIAAPALGERPAPAGAAPGGQTIQRLQSVVLPAPPSLNAMAPAAPVAPPANAMVAQAAPGAPTATLLDADAQERARLLRLMNDPSAAVRAAAKAKLDAMGAPPALPEIVRLRQYLNTLPLNDPNRKEIENRIAALGTKPEQKVEIYAPVQAIDPRTGQVVYVSREEAISGRMTAPSGETGLSVQEKQRREAKFPQATAALKSFQASATNLIKDLEALKNHPGLNSITGLVLGRMPALPAEGRAAEALFDKIVARGQFQELQNLRNSSPTGGALGNVSNAENEKLRQSFGALDRKQNASDLRKAIDATIAEIQGSSARLQDAFDMTYEYRSPATGTGAPVAPAAAPSGSSGWSVVR